MTIWWDTLWITHLNSAFKKKFIGLVTVAGAHSTISSSVMRPQDSDFDLSNSYTLKTPRILWKLFDSGMRSGFLSVCPTDVWGQMPTCGGCLVHRRMFSNIPDLSPLEANSTIPALPHSSLPLCLAQLWQSNMPPDIAKCPLVGQTCSWLKTTVLE